MLRWATKYNNKPDPLKNDQVYHPSLTYKILSYFLSDEGSNNSDLDKLYRPLLADGEGRNVGWVPETPVQYAVTGTSEVTIIPAGSYGKVLACFNNTAGGLEVYILADGDIVTGNVGVGAGGIESAEGVYSGPTRFKGPITAKWSAANAGGWVSSVIEKYVSKHNI